MPAQDLTVGVEEEFFLVDERGRLVNRGPETVADSVADSDEDDDLKPELLRCMVESATGICRDVDEVVTQLGELRGKLAASAQENGALLVASGTTPHEQEGIAAIGPGTRYHRITQHVGEFVFGGMTCGCHVHVGVDDTATALRAANHVRVWLPTLMSVCGNSPFFAGRDTGYTSARHLLWGRWPSSGPPPYLDSVDEYESIVAGLLETGAAMDRKMVYFDVRPSDAHPTVEVRISDVAGTVEEAGLLAVLVRSVVADALDAREPAPRVPTELIRAAQWRAAKEGWSATLPDPVTGSTRPVTAIVRDLVDRHAGGLRASGELDFVESTLSWLSHNGDGAHRQREAFAKAGRLDDVVRMLAEQTSRATADAR